MRCTCLVRSEGAILRPTVACFLAQLRRFQWACRFSTRGSAPGGESIELGEGPVGRPWAPGEALVIQSPPLLPGGRQEIAWGRLKRLGKAQQALEGGVPEWTPGDGTLVLEVLLDPNPTPDDGPYLIRRISLEQYEVLLGSGAVQELSR